MRLTEISFNDERWKLTVDPQLVERASELTILFWYSADVDAGATNAPPAGFCLIFALESVISETNRFFRTLQQTCLKGKVNHINSNKMVLS